jgi:hypothetical protein
VKPVNMDEDTTMANDQKGEPTQPDSGKDSAASIDENDPHKVEKLVNAGKGIEATE